MKVRRREFIDEYVENGESAVLIDDMLVVLSPLATTILSMAQDSWVDISAIADGLLAAHGPPPDGAQIGQAVADAVSALAEQGLLVITESAE